MLLLNDGVTHVCVCVENYKILAHSLALNADQMRMKNSVTCCVCECVCVCKDEPAIKAEAEEREAAEKADILWQFVCVALLHKLRLL